MNSRYPLRPLGDVLTLDLDQVPVEPSCSYDIAGVYSFGRGLFARGPLPGSDTSYHVLNRLHAGGLVLSRLKAFEGAVALIPDGFDGHFLSQEFPTFSCVSDEVDSTYLGYLCRWPTFWEALAGTSKGVGARRERVHPEALLAIKVPLPDLEEQKRLATRVEGVLATMEATRRSGDSRCQVLGEIPWAAVGSKFRDLGARWECRRLDSVVLINPEAWSAQTEKKLTFRYADIGSVLNGRGEIAEIHELSVDDAPMRARRVIRAGDIMISTVRPNLRGTALVPRELDGVVCSTGFAVLRPVEVLPEYLFVQMLSPTVVDQLAIDAHGGHYPAVTDSRLRQTQLVVPPANVQKATAEQLIGVLQLAWRLDAVQQRASSLVDALSISLLNYAYAGLMR